MQSVTGKINVLKNVCFKYR